MELLVNLIGDTSAIVKVEMQDAEGVAKCFYCGEPATQRDHIIPVGLFGPDALWNIVPSCTSCNAKRPKKGQDIPKIMGMLSKEFKALMKEWLIEMDYEWREGQGLFQVKARRKDWVARYRQRLEEEWAKY